MERLFDIQNLLIDQFRQIPFICVNALKNLLMIII